MDINKKTPLIDLRTAWPVLFTERGLNIHFKILMEFDPVEKMTETLNCKCKTMYDFFKSYTGKQKTKEKILEIINTSILQTNPSQDIYKMICLISQHFEEKIDELVVAVDVSVLSYK